MVVVERSRYRLSPWADALAIHLFRFGLMWATLELAGLVGIPGWYQGLTVNVVLCIAAAALMTRRRLWRSTGMAVAWRSRLAVVALVPLVVNAVSWLHTGVVPQEPGYALWALTLLLVGFNEELFSRGIVLSRLLPAYGPVRAVVLTAVLFGLQHLSALVMTTDPAGDVLSNVASTAIYGFALAAFQARFRWLWPLVVVHALADWSIILSGRPWSDAVVVFAEVLLVVFGVVVLRGLRVSPGPDPLRGPGSRSAPGSPRPDG